MFSLIIIIIFSVIAYLIGWASYQKLLLLNPCKMTVSKIIKNEVHVKSAIPSIKLFKFRTSNEEKLNSLKKYPVLFIPGQNGNVDQVRSLNSFIHNNESMFQYFSIDFNRLSWSAVHMSYIVNQAIFVNDAIGTIQKLYKKIHGRDVKIIIIAHSLGGIVARTATILDNHPQCAVNAMILLSSPSRRPPHSIDSSSDALYDSVNNAWRSSLYHKSNDCLKSSAYSELNLTNWKPSSVTQHVKADWKCPICTSNVRLLSLSGGEIDWLVSPSLTRLEMISPRIINITATRASIPARSTGFSLLNPIIKLLIWPYTLVSMLLFKHVHSNHTNTSLTSSTDSTNKFSNKNHKDKKGYETPQYVKSVNSTEALINEKSESKMNSIFSITQEDWDRDISPYVDPAHLVLRTIQLRDIGFPVDHQAMLWCHQVIQTVKTALLALVIDESSTSFDWNNVFPYISTDDGHNSSNYKRLPIQPVARLMRRKDESARSIASGKNDIEYFIHQLSGGRGIFAQSIGMVRTIGTLFFISSISVVLLAYYFISCAILLVPLFQGLLGDKQVNSCQSYLKLIQPSVHTHFPNIMSWIKQRFRSYLISSSLFVTAGIFAILAIILSSAYMCASSNSTSCVTVGLAPTLMIGSYGLALVAHLFVAASMFAVSWSLNTVSYGLWITLRCTLWCKPIRQLFRKIIKPIKNKWLSISRKSWIITIIWECWFFILVFSAVIAASLHNTGMMSNSPVMSSGTYLLSVFCVTSFLLFCIEYIFLIKSISSNNSSLNPLYSSMTLTVIYTPALLQSLPTFLYSWYLLYGMNNYYSTALSVLSFFDPERIHYCLSISLIALHLTKTRRQRKLPEDSIKITPVKYLQELLSASSIPLLQHTISDSDCIHEDGGKHAIFEEVYDSSAKMIVNKDQDGGEAIVLGTTYKVIRCECRSDPSLKSRLEWCEFCLCPRCQPKDSYHASPDMSDELFKLSDINPDLIVTLGILISGGYTWIYLSSTSSCLYACSLISLVYLLRDIAIPILLKVA